MKKLLLVIFLTIVPVLAHGATYYVAQTGGSDSNSCANAQSQSTPKLTINAGAGCLSAGDTLIVKAGTYSEQLQDSIPSGSAGNPTVIQANGNAAAGTGDTVMLNPSAAPYTQIVRFTDKQYITFDGFLLDMTNIYNIGIFTNGTTHHVILQNCAIQNMDAHPGDGNGGAAVVMEHESSFVTLRNSIVHDIGSFGGATNFAHGLYIKGNNHVIENNMIYNNGTMGIQLYDSGSGISLNNNIVRGNRIFGNLSNGLLLGSGDSNIAYNNILYNNGAFGISIGFGPFVKNNAAYNNTIYHNASEGINIRPYSTPENTVVRNNILWSNGSDTVQDNGTGTIADHNLLGVDPLFVNAAAYDFHLGAGSPAIHAGVVIPNVTVSQSDSAPDLGALQSGAGVSKPDVTVSQSDSAPDLGASQSAAGVSKPVPPPTNLRVINEAQSRSADPAQRGVIAPFPTQR
jgi:parallel beta-helix repeat protein